MRGIGIALMIFSIFLFFWRDKKIKILTPMEEFEKKMENLDSEQWVFEISLALREFIDKNYKTKFLQGNYKESEMIGKEEIEFLEKLDFMKYSGKHFEEMEKTREIAEKIVKKIEKEVGTDDKIQ